MIRLTRLKGEPFILNAELIQYVEARPDTFVTLTTGERLVVTEIGAAEESGRPRVPEPEEDLLVVDPLTA